MIRSSPSDCLSKPRVASLGKYCSTLKSPKQAKTVYMHILSHYNATSLESAWHEPGKEGSRIHEILGALLIPPSIHHIQNIHIKLLSHLNNITLFNSNHSLPSLDLLRKYSTPVLQQPRCIPPSSSL
jgi:hypothetical protein